MTQSLTIDLSTSRSLSVAPPSSGLESLLAWKKWREVEHAWKHSWRVR